MKFHHLTPLKYLAQTNGLMVLFQSARTHFKVPAPLYQKVRNSSPFSVAGPISALFGLESVLREPGSKHLINVRFWEDFWRPGTAKVHSLPKNWKLRPKTGNPRESGFGRKKCNFCEMVENLPKRYCFCL